MTDNRLMERLEHLSVTLQKVVEPLQPIIQLTRMVSEAIRPFSEAIRPFLEEIAPHIQHFARYGKFIDSVGRTGWLPYYTISINYLEDYGEDVNTLEARLRDFYEQNWASIRLDIEARIERYRISEETKATFLEALSAHDVGHFRCVCRVLFPTIEREFRAHFFDDAARPISSLKMLEPLKNRGTLNNFLPREAYGWLLLDKLIDHLYERVDDGNRKKYENDHVPNRHAATHGLVSYNTYKNSINMIIMTDYIFQILNSMSDLKSSE